MLRPDVVAYHLHKDGYKDWVIDEIVQSLKVAKIVKEFVDDR